MSKHLVSIEEVRARFNYCERSGELRWKDDRGHNKTAGKVAGCLRPDGYIVVRIEGRNYLAHHVVWAIVHGEWPKMLDHVDMDRANNRIVNLRLANHSQNKANRGATRANTSGFKGAYFDKRPMVNPWMAMIKVEGKSRYLGNFPTPELAHAAYIAAANSLFGEFARAA